MNEGLSGDEKTHQEKNLGVVILLKSNYEK